jgi:hypothetical protein
MITGLPFSRKSSPLDESGGARLPDSRHFEIEREVKEAVPAGKPERPLLLPGTCVLAEAGYNHDWPTNEKRLAALPEPEATAKAVARPDRNTIAHCPPTVKAGAGVFVVVILCLPGGY